MSDSACLTGNTAACYCAYNVEILADAAEVEGLTNDELKGFKSEVIVNVSAVDGYLAGALIKADSGDRMLSAACSIEIC